MANLKDLKLQTVYRTGQDDLLNDFYIPALSTAKNYDRAVGYFSTSLISYALKGISSIVKNDGKMRLIVGFPLEDKEFEALLAGHDLKRIKNLLHQEVKNLIDSAVFKIEVERLKLFSLLIATNRLQMKFAFKKRGMYHEKIGVITDSNGDKILFHGSANETTNAIHPDLNFESIAVYKNWEPEIYKAYAVSFEKGFESLWNNNEKQIHTIEMPSEVYSMLSSYSKLSTDEVTVDEGLLIEEMFDKIQNHYPLIPKAVKGKPFDLYEHQKQALVNWFENDTKGLFKLATGAGKTITAMYGISKLFDVAAHPRKMLVVIAVPYVALAEQWCNELSFFNMKPIRCFSGNPNWDRKLSSSVNNLLIGTLEFLSVVVVNKTLCSSSFQETLTRVNPNNLFFIGDECHRHGTQAMFESLPSAKFKMGLSATPYIEDEEYLESNTERQYLTEYYGDIVSEFTLADALNQDILAPYEYKICPVELTEDETVQYLAFTKEIGRLMNIDSSRNNSSLQNCIRKRNKLIQNAENKRIVLEDVLTQNKEIYKSHALFYVGEGSTLDSEENIETKSQLQSLAEVIRLAGWKVSKFTSEEKSTDRKKIMDSFVNGDIDGLVSMRVLDEGIDIPECRTAFILASSSNSRQFIQRRGRILRKSDGKEKAVIFDFVVLPTNLLNEPASKKLVEKELKRVMDFVRPALNRSKCEGVAQRIANQFDIELSGV